VDDDDGARALIRRTLERDGHTVTEANNGKLALERIREQTPSLLLMDLVMPEMDGFEVVAELRKDQALRQIPVVIVTAKDLSHDERQRLNGRVENILRKGSYDREQLLMEIRGLVETAISREREKR
jgi:CheY-like chemotaxis protein